MTDNSPATDEQIKAFEEYELQKMQKSSPYLSTRKEVFIAGWEAASIRAETAKNSGEVVGWRERAERILANYDRTAQNQKDGGTEINLINLANSGDLALQLLRSMLASQQDAEVMGNNPYPGNRTDEMHTELALQAAADANGGYISSKTVRIVKAAISSILHPPLSTPANSGEIVDSENGHVWHEKVFSSMKLKCCMNCGFIYNEDQPNKPCPGPIGVEPRSATPANSRAEAIGVKPLEWKPESPYIVARVFRGHYSIEALENGPVQLRGNFCIGDYSTASEAKAAAQADFEQRIRSALLQQEGE